MSQHSRFALVTGTNRGIGLEVARQLAQSSFEVIMTSRDQNAGEAAAARLRAEGCIIHHHSLELTDGDAIQGLIETISAQFGGVDVLVNSAGVFLDSSGPTETHGASVFDLTSAILDRTLAVNLYGPLKLCQGLVPLMRQRGYGRVVNVSSGMGQLHEMGGGFAAYRISKTALNALTRIVAAETADSSLLVNAVCPGWVKTDMGGPHATRSTEEAAQGIVWAATLPDDGPTGEFFRDGQSIPW